MFVGNKTTHVHHISVKISKKTAIAWETICGTDQDGRVETSADLKLLSVGGKHLFEKKAAIPFVLAPPLSIFIKMRLVISIF